jgi:hypothetical protein
MYSVLITLVDEKCLLDEFFTLQYRLYTVTFCFLMSHRFTKTVVSYFLLPLRFVLNKFWFIYHVTVERKLCQLLFAWNTYKCVMARYAHVSEGRDSSLSVAAHYGLDGPGIESRWGARFSAPVQTGPGTHPVSYTKGTGSFLGVKRPGVVLTCHPISCWV